MAGSHDVVMAMCRNNSGVGECGGFRDHEVHSFIQTLSDPSVLPEVLYLSEEWEMLELHELSVLYNILQEFYT